MGGQCRQGSSDGLAATHSPPIANHRDATGRRSIGNLGRHRVRPHQGGCEGVAASFFVPERPTHHSRRARVGPCRSSAAATIPTPWSPSRPTRAGPPWPSPRRRCCRRRTRTPTPWPSTCPSPRPAAAGRSPRTSSQPPATVSRGRRPPRSRSSTTTAPTTCSRSFGGRPLCPSAVASRSCSAGRGGTTTASPSASDLRAGCRSGWPTAPRPGSGATCPSAWWPASPAAPGARAGAAGGRRQGHHRRGRPGPRRRVPVGSAGARPGGLAGAVLSGRRLGRPGPGRGGDRPRLSRQGVQARPRQLSLRNSCSGFEFVAAVDEVGSGGRSGSSSRSGTTATRLASERRASSW